MLKEILTKSNQPWLSEEGDLLILGEINAIDHEDLTLCEIGLREVNLEDEEVILQDPPIVLKKLYFVKQKYESLMLNFKNDAQELLERPYFSKNQFLDDLHKHSHDIKEILLKLRCIETLLNIFMMELTGWKCQVNFDMRAGWIVVDRTKGYLRKRREMQAEMIQEAKEDFARIMKEEYGIDPDQVNYADAAIVSEEGEIIPLSTNMDEPVEENWDFPDDGIITTKDDK
ncbi:hypothetical protein IPM19_02620 [bacterium]|nr:MAG: hypothetical protein IPM19_02620 [bacterium]